MAVGPRLYDHTNTAVVGDRSAGVVLVDAAGNALAATGGIKVQGVAAAATAIASAGNPVVVGGSDGTNSRTLALDATGYVKVIGTTLNPSVSVAMTSAASYVSGDFVGTTSTPLSFASAVRVSTGIVQSLVVVDKAVQSVAGELWLFNATVTPPADSAAWSISDADAAKCIGIVPFSVYYASALNSVSVVTGIALPFTLTSGTTLFGAVVTRGAPSYTSNDLVLTLGILAD